MKALTLTLTCLVLVLMLGCSSDFGANPTTQDQIVTTTSNQVMMLEAVTPVNDIEPPVPSCETNRTGFLYMCNSGNHSVRCEIGNKSVTVDANAHCTAEIPMGSYWIKWWPNSTGYYEQLAFIAICETTTVAFNPKLALHYDTQK